MARHGCGGGAASAMDAIRNNVPCTSRSGAVVYFARMEVVLWQQGGGNEGNNDGGNDGGRDVIALAVTRAGVGWCNESRQGEVEDTAITAVGILSCGGGGGRCNKRGGRTAAGGGMGIGVGGDRFATCKRCCS
jgi:hypothetical protein